jgi:multisubunit Na+/H+ antiporter MnhG subunit
MVTMGCRGTFGVIFGIFGLQAFFQGSVIFAIITIAIAWYLLNPIIKKFKED